MRESVFGTPALAANGTSKGAEFWGKVDFTLVRVGGEALFTQHESPVVFHKDPALKAEGEEILLKPRSPGRTLITVARDPDAETLLSHQESECEVDFSCARFGARLALKEVKFERPSSGTIALTAASMMLVRNLSAGFSDLSTLNDPVGCNWSRFCASR